MIISFIPQAGLPGQAPMAASVSGDTITIDGSAYALAAVPDGGDGEWPDSPIVGRIRRIAGELHLTILWRYDGATTEPASPLPTVSVESGAVPAPVVDKPVSEGVEP